MQSTSQCMYYTIYNALETFVTVFNRVLLPGERDEKISNKE